MTDIASTGTAVRILVNGEPRQTGLTNLAAWLDGEGLDAAAVATAVNGDFVPRAARDGITLRDGDRLDVFRAIVGG